MGPVIRGQLDAIRSGDRAAQGAAYEALLAATEQPVDWAYEAWDDLVSALEHKDNRLRSIASQLLCNLSRSDPEGRILRDFDALLDVTRDERFVTARHCLQSLWKIGTVGPKAKQRLLDGLAIRFRESGAEKNGTLIRNDIIAGLRTLYDEADDPAVRSLALQWIESEEDPKYRKKYAGLWKGTG